MLIRLIRPIRGLFSLEFWRRRRKFPRFDFRLKANSRVASITKRFVLGVATSAKRNHRPPCKAKLVPSHVLDDDVIANNAIRTVINAYDFSFLLIAHRFPPSLLQVSGQPTRAYLTSQVYHFSPRAQPLTSGSQDENNQPVHVISRKALTKFVRMQPKAAEPLDNWYRRTKRAVWKNVAELRIDYPHADLVGSCIVFNIGGNKYRLIAKIKFQKRTAYIRFVLTHREYNTEGWKNDCIA